MKSEYQTPPHPDPHILLQIHDVIQSDVRLHLQVH